MVWTCIGVWDETRYLRVVGSNLSTLYWMDIFHINLFYKLYYVCLKKTRK